MIVEKIDHIALATKNIKNASALYEALLEVKAGEIIDVPDQGIKSVYIPLPGTGIEIIEPTDPEGGIQKFIDKKGEGIHHIAVKISRLEDVIKELTDNGIILIKSTTYGKLSVFIHPKSTGGVLIELCE